MSVALAGDQSGSDNTDKYWLVFNSGIDQADAK